ncbi:hypothetical protein K490DRAFT_55200 [Saccharata proteae CBS 121410]|uniref:Uncharacterized protein n=1 Tax=Saccharata proteae CBS 121410 TaxID=1314787 RepID=A0A6A5YFL9_9PEZI|nr:hypothetical protein K490DRAFT_55200 [Saccharata proteae CBS 121410]
MSSSHGRTGSSSGEVAEDEIVEIPWEEQPLKSREAKKPRTMTLSVGEELILNIEGQTVNFRIQTTIGDEKLDIYQGTPGRTRLNHFPFMRLPLELREDIYNLLYSRSKEIGPKTFTSNRSDETSEIKILSNILGQVRGASQKTGLIFANRQIMHEATKFLLENKTLKITRLRQLNVVANALTDDAFVFTRAILIRSLPNMDFQATLSPKFKTYSSLPPMDMAITRHLAVRFDEKFPTWQSYADTPLIKDLLTYDNLHGLRIDVVQPYPRIMKIENYCGFLLYCVDEVRLLKMWAEKKRVNDEDKKRFQEEKERFQEKKKRVEEENKKLLQDEKERLEEEDKEHIQDEEERLEEARWIAWAEQKRFESAEAERIENAEKERIETAEKERVKEELTAKASADQGKLDQISDHLKKRQRDWEGYSQLATSQLKKLKLGTDGDVQVLQIPFSLHLRTFALSLRSILHYDVAPSENLRFALDLSYRRYWAKPSTARSEMYLECSSLTGEGLDDVLETAKRAALLLVDKSESNICCVMAREILATTNTS